MADLLERLRAGSTFDSQGFFTLDRRKALEKMRDFQLVDAREYVLYLVQAAVCGGAREVRVDAGRLGGDSLTISLPALVFEKAVLEQPFSGLFLSQDKREGEVWRCFSIALNALLSLRPGTVEVESGPWQLQLRSADEHMLSPLAPPFQGTRVRLHEGWWKAATRSLGVAPEMRALQEKAWPCPVPVIIEDARISGGDWFEAAVRNVSEEGAFIESARVEAEGIRAALFAVHDSERNRATIVKNGVVICELSLELPLSPRVVVYADALLTNASGSDVVEDERFQTMLRVLEDGADALLLSLISALERVPAHRAVIRGRLLEVAASRWRTRSVKARMQLFCEAPNAADEGLRQARLFTCLDGKMASLADLDAELGARNEVLQYLGHTSLPAVPERLVLKPSGPQETHALARILEPALKTFDAADPMVSRLANMEKWRRARSIPRLDPAGGDLENRAFNEAGFVGELRLIDTPTQKAEIDVYLEGRFLVACTEKCWGMSMRAAISANHFKPSYLFDDVERDERWREALVFLAEQYELACEQLCMRVDPASAAAASVVPHVIAILKWYPQSLRDAGALPAALRGFPVLMTASGRLCSLSDLDRDASEFRQVHYARKPKRGPQKDHRQIVVDEGGEAPRLLNYFFKRGARVVDYTRALEAERDALANLGQGTTRLSLSGQALFPVEFGTDGVRGVMGLALSSRPAPVPTKRRNKGKGRDCAGSSAVRVLREGRLMGARTVDLEIGPLEIIVDSPRFTPTPTWDGVVTDEAWNEALEQMRVAVPSVVAAAAAALSEGAAASWTSQVAEKLVLDYVCAHPSDAFPEPIEGVALLPDASGGRASIAQVRQDARLHGRVRYVEENVQHSLDREALENRVVLKVGDEGDPYGRAVRLLFDVENWTEEAKAILARAAFFSQPQRPLELSQAHGKYVVVVQVEQGDVRGVVGLKTPVGRVSTSEVTVLHEGRVLDTLSLRSALPCEAVFSSPSFQPDRTWRHLGSRKSAETVEDALENGVRKAVGELASRPSASGSAALLSWAVSSLRRRKTDPRDQDLHGLVLAAPLVDSLDGTVMSLQAVRHELDRNRRLLWVRRECRGKTEGQVVLRLSDEQQRLLAEIFSPMLNYERELQVDEQASKNRRARRLPCMTLEGETFVAHVTLDESDMKGELAVTDDLRSSVVLATDGVMLQDGPFFGSVPVAGIVHSPGFEPTRTWDGIKLKNAQVEVLQSALDRLMAIVAERAESSDEARGALLRYYVYRRSRLELLEAENLQPPIFRLVGGERARLANLIAWQKSRKTLAYAWHDGEPTADSPIVMADLQVEAFLQEFFSSDGVERVDPPPVRTCFRQMWAQVKALKVAAMEGVKSAAGAFEDAGVRMFRRAERESTEEDAAEAREARRAQERRDRKRRRREDAKREREEAAQADVAIDPLTAALRECYASLPFLANRTWGSWVLTRLEIGRVKGSVLMELNGSKMLVNERHDLIRQARKMPHDDVEVVACLASALFTELNRVRSDVRDEDEMRFIQDLANWLERRATAEREREQA